MTDTYTDRINSLPVGYELCKEMSCPKCGEEAVYGEHIEDEDWDEDGIHTVIHGEFICVNCNYKFTK